MTTGQDKEVSQTMFVTSEKYHKEILANFFLSNLQGGFVKVVHFFKEKKRYKEHLGFQAGSTTITRSALVSVRPKPPT